MCKIVVVPLMFQLCIVHFQVGVYLRWCRSNRPSAAFYFGFSSQFLLELDSLSVSLLHVLRRGALVLFDRVLLDISGSD